MTTTCTARPSPPPEVIEAPEGLAILFEDWLYSGRPEDLHWALTEYLWHFRRRYLLTATHVFYLAKFGKHDVVKFNPRSMPLNTRRNDDGR